jgi:hypothetical protein
MTWASGTERFEITGGVLTESAGEFRARVVTKLAHLGLDKNRCRTPLTQLLDPECPTSLSEAVDLSYLRPQDPRVNEGAPTPPPELWGGLVAVDLPAVAQLRWTGLETLLDARNEKMKPLVSESVRLGAEASLRNAWLDDLGHPTSPADRVKALTIEPDAEGAESVRFVILGDPGEGDKSQYAVVRPFLARHAVDGKPPYSFAFILSDVIYPAGDSKDYPRKFYGPYQRFDGPIYAVPGNHDWDDGSLTSFVTHFVTRSDGTRVNDAGEQVREQLRLIDRWWRVWRGGNPPDSTDELVRDALRARNARKIAVGRTPSYPKGQPGPYFRIRVGRVWLIGIDTGMTGTIDHAQAEWLLEVSSDSGPKVLLTGKPLLVDGHEFRSADIRWNAGAPGAAEFSSVADIVRKPDHRYIAAIGGDIHNYQRYMDEDIHYVVAGGSGAFLASTELIGVDEGTKAHEPVALYPTRGLSQVHFELGVANRILSTRLLSGLAGISAAILAVLFLLPRGGAPGLLPGLSALGAGALIMLTYLVVRRISTRTAARSALGLLLTIALVLAALWLHERSHISLRLLLSGLAVTVVIVAMERLYALSRNWESTAVVGGALIAAIALSLLLSTTLAEIDQHRGQFVAGYVGALVVLGMGAAGVARKTSGREGSTIRERRPYAATLIAGSIWLGLMLVLSAFGTLRTVSAVTVKQWAFILISGLAVIVFGWLAHPEPGKHRVVVITMGLVLIGGTLGLVLGWDWHGDLEQRDELRNGLIEAAGVVLAGFVASAAGLVYYAKRVLRPYAIPEDIAEKVEALDNGGAGNGDTDRHEFIGAILRATGSSDLLGPIFENEQPPMLKSFLEVEVSRTEVTFTAYRASGFEAEADAPPIVDQFMAEI